VKLDATWLDTLTWPWQRRRVRRGAAALSRPGIAFMELPQATIRYRVAGSGARTLVFCADPPVVLELYDELIAALECDYRVVVFEMPAFGYSLPRAGLRMEMAPASETIRQFLIGLGPGPYTLAFPCVPAYSALWLAGHHPELVEALVLIQAPDWASELRWKQARDPKGILMRPYVGQILLRLLRSSRAAAWYRLALARRELLPRFTEETLRAFDHGACFCLATGYQHYLVAPEPAFAPVRQPALAIWGAADRTHAHSDPESIRRYLPQAHLVRIAEAGHFPELETPAQFATALNAFFNV
jgi:pimeloyl-ACP methyl ester carboxylesterase